MYENLNIQVLNTARQSAWQNGLCERNHALVDRCLAKILEDNPDTPTDMALAWAVSDKNSLQMWSGYFSYQLAFGQNPNIPGVMITGNCPKESSENVRRALRHKIRVSSEEFKPGDKVYF